MLVVCLGEEDGDSEALYISDREAALRDVTANELDRWQVDLSKRTSLPSVLVPDGSCRMLNTQ